MGKSVLEGIKILIVDDEPDILESLIELLGMCRIDTAATYEQGQELLKKGGYAVAILDIMGVDGFELLKTANEQNIPALMLTAQAMSEKSLKRSATEGAAYFAPKDKMADVALFVTDVIMSSDRKENPWAKWFERLSGYYDKRFYGTDWREKEKQFWEKRIKGQY